MRRLFGVAVAVGSGVRVGARVEVAGGKGVAAGASIAVTEGAAVTVGAGVDVAGAQAASASERTTRITQFVTLALAGTQVPGFAYWSFVILPCRLAHFVIQPLPLIDLDAHDFASHLD